MDIRNTEFNKHASLRAPANEKTAKMTPAEFERWLMTVTHSDKKTDAAIRDQLRRLFNNDATLRELNLYNNQIGDAGARAIGEGLKGHATLRVLKLMDHQIGAAGARAIGEGLKVNATLRELDLARN